MQITMQLQKCVYNTHNIYVLQLLRESLDLFLIYVY